MLDAGIIRAMRFVVVAHSLLLLEAHSVSPAPPAPRSPEPPRFLPYRKFADLPGKAVGLLVSGAGAVLAAEGRAGPADALVFVRGDGSYRWVYVTVHAQATINHLDLPIGDGSRTRRFDSLSLASPQTVGRWGIRGPYTLVEVEVNGGLGSPASDSLVATDMRTVEGTSNYPLRPAQVIERLRLRYATYLKEQTRALDQALDRARRQALGNRPATGPRETSELFYATWLPDRERLQVRLHTGMTDGDYRSGIGVRRGPPPAGDVPPAVPATGMRYGTMFGVEMGVTYEVSKTGNLERTDPLPIRTFQVEIPPPSVPQR
jgi:hypothetical protein